MTSNVGLFDNYRRPSALSLTVIGAPIEAWRDAGSSPGEESPTRPRLDRRSLAIGPHADAALKRALSASSAPTIARLQHTVKNAQFLLSPHVVKEHS
jgi:hypothetical protein